MNTDNIRELEIADYDILVNLVTAIKRTWKMKNIIAISTFIGVLVFALYYAIVGNNVSYYSSATVYSAVYGSYEESVSGVSMMNTYSGLLGTNRVCDRASGLLGEYGISSEELQSMVKSGSIFLSGASSESRTYGYTLTLGVYGKSNETIVAIANAMAQSFADEINDLLGSSTLQVLDSADGYSIIKSMNAPLFLVLFAFAGCLISTLCIFVLEFFSKTVYSVKQCEMNEDMILGILPYTEKKA